LSGELIKLVDIAPECDKDYAFIKAASRICKVSFAHTNANYDKAKRGFESGASHVTHLFNAMTPFHQFDPGVIGAASDCGAYVEVICDGIHLHPSVVRNIFRMFESDKICLISDSMRCSGMKIKAKDFRIFWDNSYAVHHLNNKPDNLKNILKACKENGNADRVYMFSSTAKITFAGAGISMIAASKKNIDIIKKHISTQTIGPDKINQLRHVLFLKSMDNIREHMKKHAAIIKPKFDMVLNILEAELGDKNIGWWTKPNGGYFISFNTIDGCAAKVIKMAEDAGVKFTKAGATFPYGIDPRDRNIRIAPTYPPLNELEQAIELFCVCVQIASIEKILNIES
jgi:hypothetical protein